VCVPYWPVGSFGGPFCHGGKGACVRLFDLLDQLVGLFGTEARARVCAFLVCWSSWWAFLAWRKGRVCVCLFGRVVQLVGRARVIAFWAC